MSMAAVICIQAGPLAGPARPSHQILFWVHVQGDGQRLTGPGDPMLSETVKGIEPSDFFDMPVARAPGRRYLRSPRTAAGRRSARRGSPLTLAAAHTVYLRFPREHWTASGPPT